MNSETYNNFKSSINNIPLPTTVFSVQKNPDGSCGEIRFYAVNEAFKKDYVKLFYKGDEDYQKVLDDFEREVEGALYTLHIPKEPKFEDICFKCAWEYKHFNTYVDTTKMYGYWTEDILIPLFHDPDDPSIAYCQFMYTLNEEMDAGKFSSVSPDIASFVIKACLELKNDKKYEDCMNTVVADLREYTNSFAACALTVQNDFEKYEIVAESTLGDRPIKEIFADVPYEIIKSWSNLIDQSNCIIIKDESDFKYYEKKDPTWVKTLRDTYTKSLCLVPFIHRGNIIGYLYIANFDVSKVDRIKDAVELITFFLTSETANHLFLERLEYLSNVDMLTGTFNRNCMNVNVDELSLKLKFDPKPFSVAFCDLNGLKTINDRDGHEAGDKLLQEAANTLKEVFYEDKIYRAGGDEFVIISTEGTEQDFLQKVANLKQRACDPDWLYFAIGHYTDTTGSDLRLAMRYADERMYKDKDAFYDSHPDKRR